MIDIKKHIFFTFLEQDMASHLIDSAKIETYQNENIIFRENTVADDIFLVLNGVVKVTKVDPSGKDQLLAFIKEDDYFGEYAVIDGLSRSAGAVAVTPDTVLARIPGDQVLRSFKESGKHTELRLVLHIIRKVRENNQSKVEELLRKERNALLGEMASAIIHDLKNPTAAILMAASIILKEGVTEGQKKMCNIIKEDVHRVITMVDEVLDFSRGAPCVKKCPVDIAEIFKRVDTLNRIPLAQMDIELIISSDSIVISADESKILRVLQNLIGNAAEALSKGNGKIMVVCEQKEDHVVIAVTDNGPGIPEEMQACLFEPFATMGKSKGTGLGMAITKSIVEAHEGRLSFETDSQKGTTFFIKLPYQE